MKTLKCALILFSFFGLIFYGCSDELQSPVSPSDQQSLEKIFSTREFTGTNIPTGVIDPGVYLYPENQIILKKHKGTTIFTALFADEGPDLLSGPGVIEISGITDFSTMTGEWVGKFMLRPEEVPDGLWKTAWRGPSTYSPTAWNGTPGWILSLKFIGRGEGGEIDGMKISAETLVYSDLNFTAWYGDFTGVIISH